MIPNIQILEVYLSKTDCTCKDGDIVDCPHCQISHTLNEAAEDISDLLCELRGQGIEL